MGEALGGWDGPGASVLCWYKGDREPGGALLSHTESDSS